MWSTATRPNTEPRDREIEGLVGLALDDLECERLEVAAALRLIAEIAWHRGYLAGKNR